MDKDAIAQCLRTLATSNEKRSKAARLREVFEDVELALSAGVSRATVLEVLTKHGLVMSLATFDGTLRRIRKNFGLHNPKFKQPHSFAAPTEIPSDEANISPVRSSHRPTDLDGIIKAKPDLAALAKLARKKPK